MRRISADQSRQGKCNVVGGFEHAVFVDNRIGYVHGRGHVIVVFHFGLGQGRPAVCAPIDRFVPPVEHAPLYKFTQGMGDGGFVIRLAGTSPAMASGDAQMKTTNRTLRTSAQLCDRGLAPPERQAALDAVAARYGVLRGDGTAERALVFINSKGIITHIHVGDINVRPPLELIIKQLARMDTEK